MQPYKVNEQTYINMTQVVSWRWETSNLASPDDGLDLDVRLVVHMSNGQQFTMNEKDGDKFMRRLKALGMEA